MKWEVGSQELVLDDIVVFHGGEQISADAIVVKGEVSVNESLLTGEQMNLPKHRECICCQEVLLCQGSATQDWKK